MSSGISGVLTDPPEHLKTEILVIGSGPGGSITSSLLAEAGREVLTIEEGPFLQLESAPQFSREEMVQKYRNGGLTVALGKAKVSYVEGCCVGGGSEINSGLYHRPPAEILDNWKTSHQVADLSEEDLRLYCEANEKELNVSYLPGPAPLASLKLHEGATRLGWHSLEIPRWFRYDNAASGDAAVGTKQTMTKTCVPRSLAAGGKLLPNTKALRLRRKNDSWELEAEYKGQAKRKMRIVAEKVFLACGTIQTPVLLRRSGLGRNVGNSLHLHPTVKVVARFNEVINEIGLGVPVHQVKEFAPRISFGCSISSPPHLALALVDHPGAAQDMANEFRHLAVYYAMTCGGVGSVRTLPFFRDAFVRFRLNAKDFADLTEAMRKLCECLFAAGATVLYPNITGIPSLAKEADLALLPDKLTVDKTNLMTIHLFSTCPMGENEKLCATDSYGKIHGEQNLWISDGSILPGPPGVNPQGTIMALARRNVNRFLKQS